MNKRKISLLLVIVLLASLLPTSVSAAAATPVATQDQLNAAVAGAQTGDVIEITAAGTYTLPNIYKNITIRGADSLKTGDVSTVVFNCVDGGSICAVPNGAVFEDLTMNFGASGYHGFQSAGPITMSGCQLNGLLFSYGDMTFRSCTFRQDTAEYMMWCYGGNCSYKDCRFCGKGKFINLYNENNTTAPWIITVTNCSFESDTKNKAAVNVKETCLYYGMLHFDVTISGCSVNDPSMFPAASEDASGILYVIDPLVQVDDRNLQAETATIFVTLNGVRRYPVGESAPAVDLQPVSEAQQEELFGESTDLTKDEQTAIVRQLTETTAVTEEDATNVRQVEGLQTLSIRLTEVEAEKEQGKVEVRALTYDVSPRDEKGNEIHQPAAPISFRLPLTDDFKDKYAKIGHNGKTSCVLSETTQDGECYVELTESRFSLFTVSAVDHAARIGSTDYSTLDAAIENATDSDTVVLLENIALTKALEIGKTVNLDLNGCVLSRSGTGRVITVKSGGKLTVSDGSDGSGGYRFTVSESGLWQYTGEWKKEDLQSNTVKKLTGGVITGGSAESGGGVMVENGGSFTMLGGSIAGNAAENGGGGVMVLGTVTLGGTAKILGNVSGEKKNDLFLDNGKTVAISSESAPTTMLVGVSTATEPTADASVRITSNGTAAQKDRFFADNSQFEIAFDADHLILRKGTLPSGGGEEKNAVLIGSVQNGTLSVNKKNAAEGDTVTVSVKPNEGYAVEAVTVTDKNGKAVEVKSLGNDSYSFEMPDSAVTLSVTFRQSGAAEKEESALSFVDVKESDYFFEPVRWAAENGVTNGADLTHFAPDAGTTRAQVVTFLWRAAGKPVADYFMNMSDVRSGKYYTEAVRWALAEGITKGTSPTTFSPDQVCTRAEIVTFLYRYAKAAPSGSVKSPFIDVLTTDYYWDSVEWAVNNQVTTGTTDTTFSPNAQCTRAQVVTFLYRWIKK